MEDLEKVKVADKDLTLKTKYRLPSSESPTPNRHRMEASQVILSCILFAEDVQVIEVEEKNSSHWLLGPWKTRK